MSHAHRASLESRESRILKIRNRVIQFCSVFAFYLPYNFLVLTETLIDAYAVPCSNCEMTYYYAVERVRPKAPHLHSFRCLCGQMSAKNTGMLTVVKLLPSQLDHQNENPIKTVS